MRKAELEREEDAERLRDIALLQHDALLHLQNEVRSLRRQLGKRSPVAQESLSLDMNVEQREQLPAFSKKRESSKKKRTSYGLTPQPELRIEEEIFTLDDADKTCPTCGGELKEMSGQFEESELVDVINIEYVVRKEKRQKFRCGCGGCVETALGSERPRAAKGSRYSLNVGANVAVDKYLNHLPLHRQEQMMRRAGLSMKSQTMVGLIESLAEELGPTYAALKEAIVAQDVVGLDQTSWKRLGGQKKHGKKKNRKNAGPKPWQMWALTTKNAIWYDIADDKSNDTFTSLLGDYQGVLIGDMLSTHLSSVKERKDIELAGCWAHVLRRFRDAEKNHAGACKYLRAIRLLYDIDAHGKKRGRPGEYRKRWSAKVLSVIKHWLVTEPALPKLDLGRAQSYLLKHWQYLSVFLDNEAVPLDNNRTERALRGPVVGRKNHYGSHSQRGTRFAAVMYSLLETAKLSGKNPAAYLRTAVKAARRGDILLPADFSG